MTNPESEGSAAPRATLADSERRRILVEWNRTAAPYRRDVCLHQLVEGQVRRTPEAPAVCFQDRQLSYEELDARANQMAHLLRDSGVVPDSLVAVCLDRSSDLVVALLGVLKAGGAYVPIDPTYPDERVAFMVMDADVSVVLTQQRLLSVLPECHAPVVCVGGDADRLANRPDAAPPSTVEPEHLAYVIYTSGSTGKPKGVMTTHAAICNRLFWMQDQYRLTSRDTVLQKTPFSFDVSVWEFFWPLMTGARLVVARPGGHQDAAYLAQLIAEQQVTVVHFVPSMLQVFLDQPGLDERCATIRHVISSGETLSAQLQHRFFERMRGELHNLYGPTEAAIDVTFWRCDRHSRDRVVPIGRPVANTQIYVLDEHMEPVPVGQTGELHIGGAQVAQGYLHRPELTAQHFVPDPFASRPGARLYKTGDLARFRDNGVVEFLGRMDHQVKLRGFRVELGEIEAVLETHPAVQQAVAVVSEDEPGDERLVAYLVTLDRDHPAVAELRQFLGRELPDYMIPSHYIVLPALPLTPSGKLDRKALPAPDGSRPDLEETYVPPRGGLEHYLAELWRRALRLDRVGRLDKFFELGGTSLQAARVINELRKNLDEFIYVVTMFEYPCVAEYAALLRRDYAPSLQSHLGLHGSDADAGKGAAMGSVPTRAVTADTIVRMQECIPRLPAASEAVRASDPKNPPALFILAPPRSGTTLLRVMLAGHPRLFAGAELQLLGFNTLRERELAFTGKFGLWLEGAIRAVMELRDCDAEAARGIIATFERKGYSTKQFYGVLQDWIGDKILVDKSPAYALDPATLAKAERDFRDPLYIHLVRHPYSMVTSFENYHMDQVLYLNDHSFTPRALGELVWVISHRNIMEFLDHVPPHRQWRIRFEDLVTSPRAAMEELCHALGLAFHPDLVEPYKNIDKKMTDGIHHDSTPMGDTKLLQRRAIDPAIADAWRGVEHDDFLGEPTWTAAVALGYERPPGATADGGGRPVEAVTSAASSPSSRREELDRQRRRRQRYRKR